MQKDGFCILDIMISRAFATTPSYTLIFSSPFAAKCRTTEFRIKAVKQVAEIREQSKVNFVRFACACKAKACVFAPQAPSPTGIHACWLVEPRSESIVISDVIDLYIPLVRSLVRAVP